MKIRNSTIRLLGLLILVVFVVQTTGLTCVGVDLPFSAQGAQAGYHSDGAATNSHDAVNPGATIGDLHQCSCHLSFARISPAAITYVSSFAVTATPLHHLLAKNISTNIFQPPESIL